MKTELSKGMSHSQAVEVYKNLRYISKGEILCKNICGQFYFDGDRQDIFRVEAFTFTPYLSKHWLIKVKPRGKKHVCVMFGGEKIECDIATFIDFQGHVRIAFSNEKARQYFDMLFPTLPHIISFD